MSRNMNEGRKKNGINGCGITKKQSCFTVQAKREYSQQVWKMKIGHRRSDKKYVKDSYATISHP